MPSVERTLKLAVPTANLTVAAPALPPSDRYIEKGRYKYDPTTANVLQTTRLRDVPTTYLWGYQNTRLIALIKNASSAQVQQQLQALGIALSSLTTDVQLRAAFVRLRQSLSQAQVTSYTYNPLVGLTSQTDPTGRTTTYEYDALGRLVRIRDEQERILSQQQYNYAKP